MCISQRLMHIFSHCGIVVKSNLLSCLTFPLFPSDLAPCKRSLASCTIVRSKTRPGLKTPLVSSPPSLLGFRLDTIEINAVNFLILKGAIMRYSDYLEKKKFANSIVDLL